MIAMWLWNEPLIVERKYGGPWRIGRLGTSLLKNPELSGTGAEGETDDTGNRGVVWHTKRQNSAPD